MTTVLRPVATQWLPELHEGIDGPREIIKLVNQLRRRAIGTSAGAGVAWFATAIGRGDVLKTPTDGTEVIGISIQLPRVWPSFFVNLGGECCDSGSAGVFRVRLGGTYGHLDGIVVATVNAASTGFQYASTTAQVTLNAQTLLQFTLQSPVGHTAQWREGSLVLN